MTQKTVGEAIIKLQPMVYGIVNSHGGLVAVQSKPKRNRPGPGR